MRRPGSRHGMRLMGPWRTPAEPAQRRSGHMGHHVNEARMSTLPARWPLAGGRAAGSRRSYFTLTVSDHVEYATGPALPDFDWYQSATWNSVSPEGSFLRMHE